MPQLPFATRSISLLKWSLISFIEISNSEGPIPQFAPIAKGLFLLLFINFTNSYGETPIIVFFAVSNDIVITAFIPDLSEAVSAASTSSREDKVSIHKKSTPPFFKAID